MNTILAKSTLLAERLKRQGLICPVSTPKQYIALFKRLQPVSPVHFSYPGAPPQLTRRTTFDDTELADSFRAEREIVKARFLHGTIGYVLADDLADYAVAFMKPLTKFTYFQHQVLEAIRHTGPLTPRQVKEETELMNKQVMPALHRLQKAFLVYEDQVETSWERAWYDFETEWPEIHLDESRRIDAVARILERFIHALVFASLEQMRAWSALPLKLLKTALAKLEESGVLVTRELDDNEAVWIHSDDLSLSETEIPLSISMLHKADILVRSYAPELKQRFAGLEVLQYLLIDGEFLGAVTGHWRIGPHNVEDIVLTLPKKTASHYKQTIIDEVSRIYSPPHSTILKYNGTSLSHP
jgi:hypothetical protein